MLPGQIERHRPAIRLDRDRELKEPSGLSTLNKYQIAERGARMARRDDREYREYLREEQRSQPGCPAREVVLDQRGQATRWRSRRRDSQSQRTFEPGHVPVSVELPADPRKHADWPEPEPLVQLD